MVASVDIVKRALAQSGTRTTITALNDATPEGLYAGLLYAPLRDFLLREGDYDFSLHNVAAVAGGAVLPPWTFSYNKPSLALRIRQLVPASYVALDPQPVAWSMDASRILTNEEISYVIYTAAVGEDYWDAIFTEAFTRLLASALSFALTNKLEFSKEKLADAISLAGIANLRDG